MRKIQTGCLSELKNLYIGWIYNPIIDVWNGFADFHNARVDTQQNTDFDDDESMTATVDGKTYPIRELWFETDFLKILSKATGRSANDLNRAKNKKLSNRTSKRQKAS